MWMAYNDTTTSNGDVAILFFRAWFVCPVIVLVDLVPIVPSLKTAIIHSNMIILSINRWITVMGFTKLYVPFPFVHSFTCCCCCCCVVLCSSARYRELPIDMQNDGFATLWLSPLPLPTYDWWPNDWHDGWGFIFEWRERGGQHWSGTIRSALYWSGAHWCRIALIIMMWPSCYNGGFKSFVPIVVTLGLVVTDW